MLLYASAGAGASMLTWIIKRLLNPKYYCSNPIDSLGSAHNQPLCSHWFGDDNHFVEILKQTPEKEQIIHCDPNFVTVKKASQYVSIYIDLQDSEDVRQAAIFCQKKIPAYHQRSLTTIGYMLLSQRLDPELYNFTICIPFKQLFYGNIDVLLKRVAECVGAPLDQDTATISSVVAQWRHGNDDIIRGIES